MLAKVLDRRGRPCPHNELQKYRPRPRVAWRNGSVPRMVHVTYQNLIAGRGYHIGRLNHIKMTYLADLPRIALVRVLCIVLQGLRSSKLMVA